MTDLTAVNLRLACLMALAAWLMSLVDRRWIEAMIALVLALLARGMLSIWKRMNS